MNKENFFIEQISKDKNSKFIGDDGAFVNGFVYSVDAFFENVHFKREWFSLKEIASKSMLVNISDAIVMNSFPKYALLTVAIPDYFSTKDMQELNSGFLEVAEEYGIKIIGGDTISNIKLDISITIISECKNPTYRKGLKEGDILAFTGELGNSKKDLEKLFNGEEINRDSKFIRPKLKGDFFYKVAPFVSSALDISDGLFFELERLSKINSVGFYFFQEFNKEIGCSGEEYEILFGFDKKYLEIVKKISQETSTEITIFGEVKKGIFTSPCKPHHFDTSIVE